jgi:Arf-GAP/coiled-coil/ANK repeat/PH domain-containing protein
MRSTVGRDAESMLQNRDTFIHATLDFVNSQVPGDSTRSDVLMQGYLFKRGSAKTFKSWKRRWFELLDKGQLVYRKRLDELPTVMEEDLRICLVRPMAECDRRFCFELISPNKYEYLKNNNVSIYDFNLL